MSKLEIDVTWFVTSVCVVGKCKAVFKKKQWQWKRDTCSHVRNIITMIKIWYVNFCFSALLQQPHYCTNSRCLYWIWQQVKGKKGTCITLINTLIKFLEQSSHKSFYFIENLVHGDIVPNKNRNADPCTKTGCKWPKYGSFVYIPVAIASHYSE